MHIPNGMLEGIICPVTAGLSVAGIILAAVKAFWTEHKPGAGKFAAVTALIFAGQMMNFPINGGTSGHLLGGLVAVALLGIPFGVLAMALVVSIQCIVFSDGGFSVLGANIFNMAIIGTGVAGIIYTAVVKKVENNAIGKMGVLAAISWVAILMAAFACSVELALAGTIPFTRVIGEMLSTHAVIGIGEGIITLAVCALLTNTAIVNSQRKTVTVPLIAAGIIATTLSPFASGFPDGLEWVAEKFNFLHEVAPSFVSSIPDYAVPGVGSEILAVSLAGLSGVILTFVLAFSVLRFMEKPVKLKVN
jgi:cobalt/nickel transport system permease protein